MTTEYMHGAPSFLTPEALFLLQSIDSGCAKEVNDLLSKAKRQYVQSHHKRSISQMHSSSKYKDGKWKTRVYVDGKRKIVETNTEDEMYEWLYAFYKAEEEAPKTFEDVFNLLMEEKRRNGMTNQTITEDTRYFNYINEKIRNKPITEVTDEELKDWIMSEYVPTKPTQQSMKKIIQVLNQIFRYGQEKKICRDNPAGIIRYKNYAKHCRLSARSNEERSFSLEDEEKIRAYAMKHLNNPHAVCMLLSMETGLRAGELAYLKKSDITEDFFLHVHGQQRRDYDGNGHQVFYDIHFTKNERLNPRNGRYIPILPDCEEVITYAENLKGESEYILHHPNGNPILKDSYMQYLRRACHSLGIEITHNHAFRVGFNAKLIAAGIDEIDRCYILGHSMETNRKHYSFSDERHRDNIRSKMNHSFPQKYKGKP